MDKNKATSPEKKAALEAIRAEFKGAAADTQCARLLEALARFPVSFTRKNLMRCKHSLKILGVSK